MLQVWGKRRGPLPGGGGLRWLSGVILIALSLTIFSSRATAQVWLGVGYDGVSQDYYLVTADTALLSPDSLDRLRQTATAVNEGQLSLRTRIGERVSWDQTTSITSLYWQHRSSLSAYSRRDGDLRGGLEYHLNLKVPHVSEDASAFSDYRVHELRAEGERRFGDLSLGVRGTGEFVHYPDPQDFAYDYRQYRGEIRLAATSEFTDYREFRATVVRRDVPDSGRVSYLEAGASAGLAGSIGSARLEVSLEGSDRRYDVEGTGLDFAAVRFHAQIRDEGYPARWETTLDLEGYRYSSDSSILSDFVRAEVSPKWSFPLGGGWAPFIRPELEFVTLSDDENYLEPRVVFGSELFRMNGLWANADLAVSHRGYAGETLPAVSDFWNLSINLLVDGPITRHVSFTILYSQDWEWHVEKADNMSVLLLSAGLKYRL